MMHCLRRLQPNRDQFMGNHQLSAFHKSPVLEAQHRVLPTLLHFWATKSRTVLTNMQSLCSSKIIPSSRAVDALDI